MFCNGPIKIDPLRNKDARAGSGTLFHWVRVHYSAHDARELLVRLNPIPIITSFQRFVMIFLSCTLYCVIML